MCYFISSKVKTDHRPVFRGNFPHKTTYNSGHHSEIQCENQATEQKNLIMLFSRKFLLYFGGTFLSTAKHNCTVLGDLRMSFVGNFPIS